MSGFFYRNDVIWKTFLLYHNFSEEKNIPTRADYMMTGKKDAGYFYDLYKADSDEDKAILKKRGLSQSGNPI